MVKIISKGKILENKKISPLKVRKTLLESLVFYFCLSILAIISVYYGLSLQQNSLVASPLPRITKFTVHKTVLDNIKNPLLKHNISIKDATNTPTVSINSTVIHTSSLSGSLYEGNSPKVAPSQSSGYCLDVPVFMYHHIEPMAQADEEGHGSLTVDNGWFDQQMAYMVSHGYNFISLSTLVHAIINHQSLPPKTVVLSDDDGYVDVYQYAFPIIQKYHIIINLFIPAGLIDNSDYMNWNQLKQMQSSGLVYIYNHTWSHYPLGQGDATKILFEIKTSQQEFHSYLGITPTIMAYPYGSFSPLAIQILQSQGFIAAFTTMPGVEQCSANLMVEPRFRIGNAPMSVYGF